MFGVIADHNTEGHLSRLLAHIAASELSAIWDGYGVRVETLAALGLHKDTDDRTIWTVCQANHLVLVTANRNHDGDDSLEAAIRDGGLESLPVVTYANADRVLRDSGYAEATAIALLDCVQDLYDRPESILGSGRLFIPRTPR